MGVTTPDGIGEKPKAEDLIITEPADVLYGQNEDVFQPEINIEPAELLADTLVNFGDIAAENPNHASEMAIALSEEIFEVFGLTENNPETLNPILESRVDDLAKAFKGNDPEEIEMATEALFNGAIDSSERLNQLAGYMLAQNGGHLAGLSVGGKNPFEEAQLKARRETERTMNIATASLVSDSIRALQNDIDNFFKNNRHFFDKLYEDVANSQHTDEEKGQHLADGAEEKILAQFKEYKETHPELSDDQIIDKLTEEFGDDVRESGLFSELTANTAEKSLREKLDESIHFNRNSILESKNSGFGTVFSTAFRFGEYNSIGTKTSLNETITDMFQKAETDIQTSRDQLSSLRDEIELKKQEIDNSVKAFIGSSTITNIDVEEHNANKAELDSLLKTLENEEKILTLREETLELASTEVERIMAPLNEDLSNLDVNFMKNAFLSISPDLMAKVQEMNTLMGNENGNILTDLLEVAEAQLSPEQFAEVQVFAQELQEAQQALQYAQEWKASAEKRLEFANQNSDMLAPTGLTGEFTGVATPLAPLNGSDFGFAMQEVENAFTILANLRAGTELEGEALKTAIYQEAILQEIGTDGVINQSEINQVFAGLGLYDDQLNNAQNSIAAFLADEHGVTVNADVPARIDIRDAPEPESPEVIAARMAGHAEQKVWENVMDEGLSTISKEEIMDRLAEQGVSGDLLISSTEQLVADFQNDIGPNAVTGLEYPESVAEEYNIGENTAPVVEEPAAPAEDVPAVQPANYDPEDPQYQNTGGAAPMV